MSVNIRAKAGYGFQTPVLDMGVELSKTQKDLLVKAFPQRFKDFWKDDWDYFFESEFTYEAIDEIVSARFPLLSAESSLNPYGTGAATVGNFIIAKETLRSVNDGFVNLSETKKLSLEALNQLSQASSIFSASSKNSWFMWWEIS